MAKPHPDITGPLRAFIERQRVFFVATAPLAGDGHVNLSPKGLDALRVLSPTRVAYLDLVGSGNETSAHLLENGRITLMFCAFEGPPQILRVYGTGRVVLPNRDEWSALAPHFAVPPSARQIVVIDVTRVQTSCGYGVPLFDYRAERDQLARWAEKKGAEGLEAYKRDHNLRSIDGLPTALAVDPALSS